MSSTHRPLHGLWSSPAMFVLAVAGVTIGLGNVWTFPALLGQHGGAAFLGVYLLWLLLLGFPLAVSEVILGRRGRRSAITTLATVAVEEGRLALWQWPGWLGAIASLLLLSTYGVIGGWLLGYTFRAATGVFTNVDPLEAADIFQEFIRDPERLLAWHTLFVAVTVMIVGRGLRWGLEEAVRWFMPMLLGLLLLLTAYAVLEGDWRAAGAALLWPDPDELDLDTVLLALRHAFFTLSVGLGVIVSLGAYLSPESSALRLTALVVLVDLLAAGLAAMLVYSVLLGEGLGTVWETGPELVFQLLPLAFGQMTDGIWFGTLFFLLLGFAALTSAIALLEPAVAYSVERFGLDRAAAASYVGVVVWALGLVSLLSFNLWQNSRPLAGWPRFSDSTPFDLVNFLAVNILLPLAALGIALFAGWRMSAMTVRLEIGSGWAFRVWRFCIRYLVPVAVALIFWQTLGVPS